MKHVTPEMFKEANEDSYFLLYYRHCETTTDVLVGKMQDYWFIGIVTRHDKREKRYQEFNVGYRLAPGDSYPKAMYLLSDEEALLYRVCEEI